MLYFIEKVLNPLITETEQHIESLGTLTKMAKQVTLWKEVNEQIKQKVKDITGIH